MAGCDPGSGATGPLHVEVDGETTIQGWAISLREAVTNLIFNAVDALPAGGTIRVSARRVQDCVVLEVADSGLGMSAEILARIFDPFFTTKGERGTGLGLAQVYSAVEQHQGTIVADSTPGCGTTFRLTIPAASVRPGSRDVEPVPLAPIGRLRILAVDDEPAIASMVRRILRHRGHLVATATSGEEALARLAAEPFDVLLSDVGMGQGMNGWELVERVRASNAKMRVVLATGWGAGIDHAVARSKGVDAIIAKPYRPADLERLLDRLPERSPTLPEAA